ncbi:MAG: hypothetical protein V1646_01970 [bacterium]
MPVKELSKSSKSGQFKSDQIKTEKQIEQFISKGGGVTNNISEKDDDHRLTLRIPKKLLAKIDLKRKDRVGNISRNLWILEVIDKAANKI